AERIRHAKDRAARKTPLYPSHLRALERKRKAEPRVKPGDRYTVKAYNQAVSRACQHAEVPHWFPNQLRHNAGTRIEGQFGFLAASAILGHKDLGTTQIYVEANRARAREVAEKIG